MFVFIYILSLDWIVLFLRQGLEDTIELVEGLMLHFFCGVLLLYVNFWAVVSLVNIPYSN